MAQVPTLDNFDQTSSPGANTAFAAPEVRNTAGINLEKSGDALMSAGSAFGDIARDKQNQANQLRTDDAINQLQQAKSDLTYDPETGYTQLKGIDALQRPDGQSLSQEYGAKLQEQASTIGASLDTNAQRIAFARAAGNMQSSFHGELEAHAGQQFTTYAVSVRDGTIANAQDDLARNYGDPAAVARGLSAIEASSYDKAQLTGMSPEAAQANARAAKSNALSIAASAALQNNDIGTAKALLATHGKDMDASDLLRVQGAVTKQNDAQMGQMAGIQAFSGTPGAAGTSIQGQLYPDNFGRLANLADPALTSAVATVESNNNPNAVSKAGAKGTMQVMDATAANPGHGIAPSDGTSEDRARVGRQLLQALVQKYQGDTVHALWAYNWGEGNVDSYLKTGHGVNGQPMPVETQQYANKVYIAYKGGGGAPDATQHGPLLSQALAAIDNRTDLSPEARKIAYDTIKERYAAAKDDYETNQKSALGSAYQSVVQNGGQLDPRVYAQVPPTELPALVSFSKSFTAAQREPKAVSDPVVYGQARQAIVEGKITDPTTIAAHFVKDLSPGDLKSLQDLAIETANKTPKRVAYDSVAKTGIDTMRPALIAAGINPSPKPDDTDGAAKLAQFHTSYYQQLDNLEHVHGANKPLTSDDARGIITGLLGDTGLGSGSAGSGHQRGFELSSAPGHTPTLGTASIPSDVRSRISVYLRQTRQPVTDRNVQMTYARLGENQ